MLLGRPVATSNKGLEMNRLQSVRNLPRARLKLSSGLEQVYP